MPRRGFIDFLLRQVLRSLFKIPSQTSRRLSAPIDDLARATADTVTEMLQPRSKALKNGFVHVRALEPYVGHQGTLNLMAEFLRHKRNEYLLVGYLVGGELRGFWLTMGTRARVTFCLDDIVEGAVQQGCAHIILGHNHPGPDGALAASPDDVQMKKDLERRLEALSVRVESYIFNRGYYVLH